jgi:UDP-N-acetylglucosamine 4-epimerase
MEYKELSFPEGSVFLVTGGAGFIGSNLCEALLRMGHTVRCLDDLSNGKRSNIDAFMNHPKFTFIPGDIRDYETCLRAARDAGYVLHQAAWGSVPRSVEMPLLYEEINVGGTLNMLEAARQNGVRKFVYASSSSVYGDSPDLPKTEGREGNLLSPYAVTKRTCEEYGRIYASLYGLETYGLRYFNVFGKRQDPNGAYAAVIPKFIGQLLRGERPAIYGDGRQSRDFTYVENVVDANLKACAASREAAGEVYNIACGGREYLIDIYNALKEALGVEIDPVFLPERKGDILHSCADISRAREMLGYDPKYGFSDGIALAVDWYRQTLSG